MATETVPQDQRRLPMEALERRLAAAKAQLLQNQKKNERDIKETVDTPSSFKESHQVDSLHNSSNTSSKNVTKESDVAYVRLPESIDENLLTTSVKFSSTKGNVVDKLLHDLLRSGDAAHKYMQGSRSKKIDNWILLDNLVQSRSSSAGSHPKGLSRNLKRSKRHMSMKQLKKSGALSLPKDLRKFDMFKPMHEMWEGYMRQLIKATGKDQLAQALHSAELHGAFILVAECKVTSFTGVNGIMVRETAETFGIITRDDKFKVVPKKVSVFIVQIDCWKITLQGDKLTSRNRGLQR